MSQSRQWLIAAMAFAALAGCRAAAPAAAAEDPAPARDLVAFSRIEDGVSKICILETGNGEVKTLWSSKEEVGGPVVCTSGGFVIFVSQDNQLHRVGTDGKDHRFVTGFPKGDRWLAVDVSSDGKQAIVALCACTEKPEADGLHLVDLQSGKATQLTSDDCYHPQLSPDGKWVAFESSRDGHYQIFVMDLASRKLTKLSVNDEDVCYGARWSPDGKQVAFHNSDKELFVADAASGRSRRVAKLAENSKAYAFSPDGKQLAFQAAGAIEVVVVNGGRPIRLAETPMGVASVQWSSDGKSVIFDQLAPESWELKAIKSVDVETKVMRILKEW